MAKVVPGQVVQPQDTLFQIVDPKGLWVEALAYGEIDPTSLADATAVTTTGQTMALTYQGFSRALQQHALIVHFVVPEPPNNLSIGQPVTVLATSGARSPASLSRAMPWCAAAMAKPSYGCMWIPSDSSRSPCGRSHSMRPASLSRPG
jgi:hypothetical protein